MLTHPTPLEHAHHAVNGHRAAPGSPVDLVLRRRFSGHTEFDRTTHAIGTSRSDVPVDFLFLTENEPHAPEDVFERLRWGGQVVYVSRNRGAVEAASKAFAEWKLEDRQQVKGQAAWVIEHKLAAEKRYLFNLRMLGWRTPVYFMVAHKVMLVPPGKSSDRFTYHVHLEKNAGGHYEVVEQVPTVERVMARLRDKFPEADEESLLRRAKKFTDKIFPVFLTRETAMLRLLQRDLPKKFRAKVPRLISGETDEQGFTRILRMKWLRNERIPKGGHMGDLGRPLTQLEFARQSAELLAALHDDVRIMHLDLRLDNFVITSHGVGFVDFGSAVRVGEAFQDESLLSGLFEEMMRTSQIQRMLGKMTKTGQVTSQEIKNSYNRMDKAVDFFYLAVQINAPHANPDFRGLVEYDPESDEAKELSELTEQILRPTDTDQPRFTSAKAILEGIEEIEERLGKKVDHPKPAVSDGAGLATIDKVEKLISHRTPSQAKASMEQEPKITAWPIKTLPPRSGIFFLAIILGPIALFLLGLLLLHPMDFLALGFGGWIFLLSGIWMLGTSIHQSCISYRRIPEGIVRRAWLRRDVMPWEEIQAIGRQIIRSKGDPDAELALLFGKRQTFQLLMPQVQAGELASILAQNAPDALRINESHGTFILPQHGDDNEIRGLVARHAKRLRRQHVLLIAVFSVLPVLAIFSWVSRIQAGIAQSADWKAVLFSLAFFLILSWGSLSALWRLRK